MAKGSRGGKRKSVASNAKYNGFSITRKDGTTSHYKVINGKVEPAVTSYGSQNMLKGIGSKDPVQTAYDKLGSVNAVIKQVNKIGKAKASILSDKAIDKMNDSHNKMRAKDDKDYSPRHSKKGINRHRRYWSAM